ncbi:OmpG porin family protein, partial [Vibrio sinaloensis]
MKKTVVASSVLLTLAFSGVSFAEDLTEPQAEKDAKLAAAVEQLKSEYSNAELLTALSVPQQEESKFHGTLGSNVEVERLIRDDGVNEGKVKYTIAQGSFRHDDLPGWDFGFYSGREELFTGNLKHADYNRGVNSIQEIYVNRSYNHEKGNIGWGLKLAGESIDQRTTPGGKVFGSYQLTDRLGMHG